MSIARRVIVATATLAAMACIGSGAVAQQSSDWDRCVNKQKAALDIQISGCTAVIQSGKETDPNLPDAVYNRGRAYQLKGEPDRALLDFDQTIKLDPKDASAFNNRGNSYRAKGDNDRAIQDYDQAIRLDLN